MHSYIVQQVLPHSVICSLSGACGIILVWLLLFKAMLVFVSFCKASETLFITELLLLELSRVGESYF